MYRQKGEKRGVETGIYPQREEKIGREADRKGKHINNSPWEKIFKKRGGILVRSRICLKIKERDKQQKMIKI